MNITDQVNQGLQCYQSLLVIDIELQDGGLLADGFDHALAIWAVTLLFVLAVSPREVDVVPGRSGRTAVLISPCGDGDQ